ncbi:MAG TPA: DUF933 domain-containing protein, partial [Azospirillum sp.]|nr:DUF933 domain-containing protein [Azospirillum sp.]
ESLERQITNLQKKAKGGDKDAKTKADLMERALKVLQDGKPARVVELDEEEKPVFKQFMLLTAKPVLYVCNVEEASAASGNKFSELVAAKAKAENAGMVVISAAIESEVAQLSDPEEKAEFLGSMGLEETGLNRLIRAGFTLLDLITFFTVGPKEARAWTVRRGAKAPEAAGVIHTDFERGFIRAETIDYDSFVTLGGEQGAKDAGKMRQEGKEYVVQDGDIFHFRFNV